MVRRIDKNIIIIIYKPQPTKKAGLTITQYTLDNAFSANHDKGILLIFHDHINHKYVELTFDSLQEASNSFAIPLIDSTNIYILKAMDFARQLRQSVNYYQDTISQIIQKMSLMTVQIQIDIIRKE